MADSVDVCGVHGIPLIFGRNLNIAHHLRCCTRNNGVEPTGMLDSEFNHPVVGFSFADVPNLKPDCFASRLEPRLELVQSIGVFINTYNRSSVSE